MRPELGTTVASEIGACAELQGRPCLRCGYDLRGLGDDGRCPECGLAVARSAIPNHELRHAPPGWLASLSWGTRLVLAVMVATIVWGNLVGEWVSPPSLDVALLMEAAAVGAFAAGVWLLTRPQRRFDVSGASWRWVLRLFSLLPLVHIGAMYAAYFVWSRAMWVKLMPMLAMLCLIPLPALLFLHLRRLALRLPNASLVEHCAIVGIGATASFAVSMSAMFVRLPWPLQLIGIVGGMLFYTWCLFVLVRFDVAFARARRTSRAAWAGMA